MTDWTKQIGSRIGDYTLRDFIDKGNHGAVFRATDSIDNVVALKLLPRNRLKVGWQTEARKASKLTGVAGVVQFLAVVDDSETEFAALAYQFVPGRSLSKILEKDPERITIPMILDLVDTLLRVVHAIQAAIPGGSHGDLHSGNVMISDLDERYDPPRSLVLVTDFGIGGSLNQLKPKNDVQGVAEILSQCLGVLDPADLGADDRAVRDSLIRRLLKHLEELDPTAPTFTPSPALFRVLLKDALEGAKHVVNQKKRHLMNHPFDYTSCEQLFDAPDLLGRLFNPELLGSQDLTSSKNNVVLTGPRGCGKTTMFANNSLRDAITSGRHSAEQLGPFVGIYYHASDLHYAFPYNYELTDTFKEVSQQYFLTAITCEVFDSLSLIEEQRPDLLSLSGAGEVQEFVHGHFPSFTFPPYGHRALVDISRHLRGELLRYRRALSHGAQTPLSEQTLPLDFLRLLVTRLRSSIPLIDSKPFFFFLDDYSLPKIRRELQLSLNRVIFQRHAAIQFKVSTDSIVSVLLEDADGKVLEEGREYEVVDVGAHFVDPGAKQAKRTFLKHLVNSRFENTQDWGITDIGDLLGDPREDYNDAALTLRKESGPRAKKFEYHGFSTLSDLCSGDIAQMLLVLRDMVDQAGGPSEFKNREKATLPISPRLQDAAISRLGGQFLERVERIRHVDEAMKDRLYGYAETHSSVRSGLTKEDYELGPHLRRITQAIGNVARWELENLDSPNQGRRPPKQPSRIEIKTLQAFPAEELRIIYHELLRYSILIRDLRGKSLKGIVVPRLQIRRLLVPKFRLTFSARDNIGLSMQEFFLMLSNPEAWEARMKKKKRRSLTWTPQRKLQAQD